MFHNEGPLARRFYKTVTAAVGHVRGWGGGGDALFGQTFADKVTVYSCAHRGEEVIGHIVMTDHVGYIVGASSQSDALRFDMYILRCFGQDIQIDDHIGYGGANDQDLFHADSNLPWFYSLGKDRFYCSICREGCQNFF